MAQRLDYATDSRDAVFHQTLDDGSIRIDIRPLGWRQAMNVRSRADIVGGGFFALLGLVTPVAVIAWRYWSRRDAEMLGMLLLAVLAEAAVVAAMAAFMRHRARHHVELTAGPAGLTWWASGPMDPRNRHWPREAVLDVVVAELGIDGDVGSPRSYRLSLRLRDSSYELISDRPKAQLEEVARLCRQGLGLAGPSAT
jgi:hypothetical protein